VNQIPISSKTQPNTKNYIKTFKQRWRPLEPKRQKVNPLKEC